MSQPTPPTPPSQYDRAKEIFQEAVELPAAQRQQFLDERCAGDTDLRAAIVKLLAAHERAAEFMAGPTADGGVFEADSAPRGDLPHRQVGPYKLLQVIGEGGFGTVYMADQEQPVRRRVALKIVKAGMDTRQVIARFEAERQALAMMDHPGIARVFDAGATETGRPYFAMELVSGVPITQYCDQLNLSITRRLELFVQVCQAVQHAHQKGLIHRDIKPGNILVSTQDDRPLAKVIDFGIAKATQARLTEKTLFTEFRQLIGTPEYMSPEQAEGSLDIDTRSDVYSLGVLLYELLTGTTPFDPRELRSKAYGEIQRVIREVDPPRPSTRLTAMKDELASLAARRAVEPRKLGSLLRGELDWIVMKCLEKGRARRYESAAALAADVTRHLVDEAVIAGPPSQLYRLQKFVKRHRAAVLSAALVLSLLIAGITGTTIGLVEARKQRDQARRQEEQAKQQAAIAEAVGRFQRDMLAAADPEKLLGERVTVLQAITGAMRELDSGKLKDQPMVEAGVREIIGSTLRMLGRFDDAEPNLRRSLELRRRDLPAGHLAISQSADELATLLEDRGNLNEAEPLFRESLQAIRSARPANHPDIGDAVTNLGHLLHLQGRFSEAEPLFVEALAIRRGAQPPDDLRLANALNNLAGIRNSQRRYTEAEPLFAEALAIRRRVLPPGHTTLANSLMNVGWVSSLRGNFAQAEPLFREALEINRKAFPAGHPRVAQSISMLGNVLEKQGKLADAEALHRESIELFRQAFPDGHPDVARSTFFLARMLANQQRFADAEPLFGEALRVQRKTLPPGHRDIVGCLNELAVMLMKLGRLEEAESLFREALDGARKTLAPNSQEIVISMGNLGEALRRQRKFAAAEPLLLDAERAIAGGAPVPAGRHNDAVSKLLSLYTEWDQAEPGQGYDLKARQWQGRLPATVPTTGP